MIEKLKDITGGVVDTFKEHPVLMLVLVLNAAFIGAGLYFLGNIVEGAQHHTQQLIDAHAKTVEAILRACGPKP